MRYTYGQNGNLGTLVLGTDQHVLRAVSSIPLDARPYVAAVLGNYRPYTRALIDAVWPYPVPLMAARFAQAAVYAALGWRGHADVAEMDVATHGHLPAARVGLEHVATLVTAYNDSCCADGEHDRCVSYLDRPRGIHPQWVYPVSVESAADSKFLQ